MNVAFINKIIYTASIYITSQVLNIKRCILIEEEITVSQHKRTF